MAGLRHLLVPWRAALLGPWLALSMLTGSMLAAAAPDAGAQYFGRNKVQYESFSFRTLATEHFDIYYYPEEEELAHLVARMAERWYARLSHVLATTLSSRQPLILYGSQPHFAQTNAVESLLGEGVAGVTEGFKRRIVLPAGSSLAETDHVVGHELVHAFQYDALSSVPQRAGMLPLWFIEGMAEYLSVGPHDPHTAMWLRDAVLRDDLPSIRHLNNPRLFPYRYGHALWTWLAQRFGDRIVADALFIVLLAGATAALEAVTGMDEKTLSSEWHRALREQFAARPATRASTRAAARGDGAPRAPDTLDAADTPDALSAPAATAQARALITRKHGGGRLNVGPSLSPDGRRVAFFSERGRLAVDLFLADASTGKVLRKLTSSATDPHFDALQFIQSAGAWDATSTRFVFAGIHAGKPVLSIVHAATGRTEREIALESLGEIHHPAWSPDGRAIAFSASAGGLSDLYTYDLTTGRLRRLTSDAFADLQPAWSPDGTQLAFVTDRFGTDLATLAYGPYRLATIDLESLHIRALPHPSSGKQIDPRWAADGKAIYFVSDGDGISNVYRLRLEDERIARVTDVATGVSGLTPISSALAISGTADRLVMSVYHDDGYELHAIDRVSHVAGAPALPGPARVAALAPARPEPLWRPSGSLESWLTNPARGLPSATAPVRSSAYESRLELDYVGQPYIVAGADRFGGFAGGGTAFIFSDMLGDRIAAFATAMYGNLDTLSAQAIYLNRKHRWTWGAAVTRVPFISGAVFRELEEVDGRQTIVQGFERFTQISEEATGLAVYPFNQSFRAELSAGWRRVSYGYRVDRDVFDLGGDHLFSERRQLPAPATINVADAGAALVYDTSVLGPTGPLAGRRWRLEVGRMSGTVGINSVLADVREYWMPVRPFTVAARLLHVGRYGPGSEDARLVPFFLGFNDLVRGYRYSSFDSRECQPDATSACPAFDRLIGNRILVANAELRFPLAGLFRRELAYGPVPVEGLIFADAGVAWSSRERPSFAGGRRDIVRSAGAGVRVNALNMAIVELSAVRPLDRPGHGWTFIVALVPGF